MSTGKAKLCKYCRITAAATLLLLVLLTGSFSPAMAAGPLESQESPVNPAYEAYRQQHSQGARASSIANNQGANMAAGPAMGYMPHPFNMVHIKDIPVNRANKAANIKTAANQAASTTSTHTTGTYGLPATFDWRTQNKVTPVRDQNPCGTCWIFGSMASLESKVYIQNSTANDFSEQNLACCVDPAWTYLTGNRCNAGGDSFIAAETLIRKGTRLESCDPYNYTTINTEACNANGCATSYMVTDFRIITNSVVASAEVDLVKSAIYNTGPVTTSFCWGSGHIYTSGGFNNVYYWPGCVTEQNHLVCIVGWDDTVPHPAGGGTGAWILKNSWGTAWANAGYFYMCYGSGNMGEIGSYQGFKDYNARERLYTWDEAGMTAARGYSDTSAWMASVYTAATAGSVTHVDFWTTSNNAQYQAYIYNGSFGSTLTTQTGTCAELGYYSTPLTSPVTLTAGQVFTVAVKMTTPGYNYPIPVERADIYSTPTFQSGVSFIRYLDSESWTDLATASRNAVCRARVLAAADDPGIQKLIGAIDGEAGSSWAGYMMLDRWTTDTTGTMSQLRIKCSGPGNVKVAVYADSSGEPGTLLSAINTSSPVSSGWNTINLTPPVSVTAATAYWLAFAEDANIVYYQSSSNRQRRAAAVNYASFAFPNAANVSTYNYSSYYNLLSGYGTITPPSPPTAPTVTNSSGAAGITSTTARLNGEMTSAGNGTPAVQIYWGDNDGGTTTGSWDHHEELGVRGVGTFYVDISGLTANTSYYYRCFATNGTGLEDWADSTSTFSTIVQTLKLIGADNGEAGSSGAGYLVLDKWTADTTGTMSQLRIKCSGPGNVKVAVYSDSSGEPGTLVSAVDTSTAVSTGWNTINLATSASITAGTAYWLAFAEDASIVYYQNSSGRQRRATAVTYSSFTFPGAANVNTYNYSSYYNLLAGYGVMTPPSPPTAPTVTNSSGATGITSTSARLNGEITNSGNGTPTVQIYWGDNDGGTTTGSWDHHEDLGARGAGTFYADISSLTPNMTYYYRCFATNGTGLEDWADSTVTFSTLVQTQKLVGAIDGEAGSSWAGYMMLDRWTTDTTGTMSQLRIKCSGPGNVKVAVYADSSGEPGTLLSAINTSSPVSSGWNTINLTPPVSVTAATAYWLAFAEDANIVYYQNSSNRQRRAAAVTYASFTFPNAANVSTYNYSPYYNLLSGYGTVTPISPPVAPSIVAPGASILFKWSAADTATNYGLHVGTAADFQAGTFVFNNQALGNVTQYEVTSGFTLGTTYYWRVNASNSGGTSAWSQVRSITVQTQ